MLIMMMLAGCGIHYPTVGVKNKHRVKPTDWKGQTCEVTLDQETHKKVYVCGPDRFRR